VAGCRAPAIQRGFGHANVGAVLIGGGQRKIAPMYAAAQEHLGQE
jgi:hypothetical protein